MPTLKERLVASKQKAERARARLHKLEGQVSVYNRRRIARLFYILGEGVVVGKLVTQCLPHIDEEKCLIVHEILREQADSLKYAASASSDAPSNQASG